MISNTIACSLLVFAAIAACLQGDPVAPSSQTSRPPVQDTLAAPILVAGFAVRTSNAKEMNGNGEIGKLWQRFYAENLAAKIPNRAGQSLIVVYSDYASDEKGEYTYLLGAPVPALEGIPAGMQTRQIAPGAYAVLTTPKGPLIEGIQSAWKRIWAMDPAELGGRRSFLADYEIYDQRSRDPNNAQVEIHIGLVPKNR